MSSARPSSPLSAPEGDRELAARAAAGDARAFESMMRRHNRRMYRTARALLRDDAESEEAVQDAYLRAWRALPQFRGEAQLSTWLVRIVVNQALSRLRRRGAVVIPFSGAAAEAQEEQAVEQSPQADSPESQVMRTQLRRVVEAHIDRLPSQFRTVFVLRALEDMSVEEVAQALEIPEATVRTRFFRARALLRESLSCNIDFATEDAFSFAGERCDRIVSGVLRAIRGQGH